MYNKNYQKPKRTNPELERQKIQARIKQAMDEAYHDGMNYAIMVYTLINLIVLSDKTSLTEEDIGKVVKEIDRASESISENYVTVPDIIRTLKEEYHYKFDIERIVKWYPQLQAFLESESGSSK